MGAQAQRERMPKLIYVFHSVIQGRTKSYNHESAKFAQCLRILWTSSTNELHCFVEHNIKSDSSTNTEGNKGLNTYRTHTYMSVEKKRILRKELWTNDSSQHRSQSKTRSAKIMQRTNRQSAVKLFQRIRCCNR